MNKEEKPKTEEAKDSLDRYLDRALLALNGEPRPGLEHRVLAHVQSAPKKSHWWIWLAVPAFAALVVLAIVSLTSSWHPKSWRAKLLPSSPSSYPPQTARSETSTLAQQTPQTMPVKNARTTSRHRTLTAPDVHDHSEKSAKLPTFPSTQPLSSQERLLVALVQNHPEQLKEIADWQQEFTRPPAPEALNPEDNKE